MNLHCPPWVRRQATLVCTLLLAAGSAVKAVNVLCTNGLNKALPLPFRQYMMPPMRQTIFKQADSHAIKFMKQIIMVLKGLGGRNRSRIDIVPPAIL